MANINQMIADLDQQISSLQTARQALAESHGVGPIVTGRGRVGRPAMGRPPLSGYNSAPKRTMSPEARDKIRAAQKLRWAKVASDKKTGQKTGQAKKVAAPAKSGYRPRAKKVVQETAPLQVEGASSPQE